MFDYMYTSLLLVRVVHCLPTLPPLALIRIRNRHTHTPTGYACQLHLDWSHFKFSGFPSFQLPLSSPPTHIRINHNINTDLNCVRARARACAPCARTMNINKLPNDVGVVVDVVIAYLDANKSRATITHTHKFEIVLRVWVSMLMRFAHDAMLYVVVFLCPCCHPCNTHP